MNNLSSHSHRGYRNLQTDRNLLQGNKLILIFCMIFSVALVSAIPQTFNIHGKLSNSSEALSGTYDMNFSLCGKIYIIKNIRNSNIIPGDLTRLPDESFVFNGNIFKSDFPININLSPQYDLFGNAGFPFFFGGKYYG